MTYILQKCKRTFCGGILEWDLADCQKIDAAFPLHRKLADIQSERLDRRNLLKVRKIFALKKMSKAIAISGSSGEAQQKIKGVLQKLSKEKVKCLMVTTTRNAIWRCMSCLFKDDDSAHLVLDLSPTSVIIVTDFVPEHICSYCNIENKIQFKDCVDLLQNHNIRSESHRHLLSISDLVPYEGTCISLYHRYEAKVECIDCIRRKFVKSEKYYTTTPYSTLLDASEFRVERTLELFDEMLKCHRIRVCRKIEIVPQSFCTEHQAFVKMTPSEPQTQIKTPTIHILSVHIIPVGIWPPSSQQTAVDSDTMPLPSFYLASISSKSRTPIRPFSNTIAFVEFKSAKSQQLECAICLVQHSEVFFVHVAEDEVTGYVWIGQAPSHILRLCLKKTCLTLTYTEKRLQLKRPVGLRQWTAYDLKSGG